MIQLPALFEQTLSKKPDLLADVRKTLDSFEPWLEQSGMPFFPGFTDHSPRHINDVLKTASALISDSSHPLLSAEDIAVLVIAVLLHDCGMHLTQDGFRALVSNDRPPLVAGLGDMPWQTLWLDFLGEAQRFGEDRLMAIFGDKTPVTISEIDIENLTERDFLLIGEFIRRNHARLAHEIALSGVPTKSEKPLLISGLDQDLKDLAGLVARSHGMSIRDTFPYLSQKYSRIFEYRSIKVPYLMAVVRIADYVQVQSERALKSLLSVKELRSPVSRQEWRNHFAVADVSMRDDDPEAMYVHAKPVDVKTFLRLEALFRDIQRELDSSWATLGEVFGRLGELSKLGLAIRRIRSNIDDRAKFSSTVQYVPVKAGFQSSGPDLLKLLVGPLYDYKYSVGLRELIQNAIDACRERTDISEGPRVEAPSGSSVLVDIQEAEDGTGWVTVQDNGVGMSLETVINYFLVAGASFRNSDVWKKQHTDQQGNVRVMRGGRFGVGALAAFLLGDEIQVRTRHYDRDELQGIEFSARMDDPVVELRRCAAPAGTSIKIWVSDHEAMRAIRPPIYGDKRDYEEEPTRIGTWSEVDWYAQTEPAIEYRWSGFAQFSPHDSSAKSKVSVLFTPNQNLVPNSPEEHEDWIALHDPAPYKALLWQYPTPEIRKTGGSEYQYTPPRHVVVNGIRVESLKEYGSSRTLALEKRRSWTSPSFIIERPSLAIFDPAGICPINLQRSAISFDRMGKDVELAKSVLREYVKSIQLKNPKKLTVKEVSDFLKEIAELPGVQYPGHVLPPICATRKGLFLSCEHAFTNVGIRRVFFVQSESAPDIEMSQILEDGEAIFFSSPLTGEQAKLTWFRVVFAPKDANLYRLIEAGFPYLPHTSESAILTTSRWSEASAKGKVSKELLSRIHVQTRDSSSVTLQTGDSDDDLALTSRLKAIRASFDTATQIAGWNISGETEHEIDPSLIVEIWAEQNGGNYLRSHR